MYFVHTVVMTTKTKIVKLGNSKGIRIPKSMLIRAGLKDEVVMQEVNGGILIQPVEKLSWDETYKEIGVAHENWSDWTEFDLDRLNED